MTRAFRYLLTCSVLLLLTPLSASAHPEDYYYAREASIRCPSCSMQVIASIFSSHYIECREERRVFYRNWDAGRIVEEYVPGRATSRTYVPPPVPYSSQVTTERRSYYRKTTTVYPAKPRKKRVIIIIEDD